MEHPQIRGLSEWRPRDHGGLADLWEARQESLDRCVAVKIYGPSQDAADQGFLREVTAAGRLSSHPGVVTVYDAGILPDDRLYLIMEHCPGGPLTRWLSADNRLSDEQVRRIGVQIADALAAAHALGIVHRNVTPASILLDRYDNARLVDFGLAVVNGAETDEADAPAPPSDYAPPEVVNGRPPTESGDVFSLAATLWALLTGDVPRPVGAGTEGTADGHRNGTLSAADPSLVDTLTDGLAVDPAMRPTAAQLRDQLLRRSIGRESEDQPTADAADNRPTAADVGSSGSPHPPATNVSEAVPPGSVVARGAVDPAATRPGWARRRAGVPVLAAAALLVIVSGGIWMISDSTAGSAAPESRTATAKSSSAPDPGFPTSARPGPAAPGTGSSSVSATKEIQVDSPSLTTKPFEVVQIRGTYAGGSETFVHAQRREGGEWVSFPLPAKTDQSGRFTLYVELGKPGRYQLRTLDPESGLTSEVFVLLVQE